jgi:hypothetical protein
METLQIIQITPNELVNLISDRVCEQLNQFTLTTNSNAVESTPHLTRKETAQYFGVSLNCINDWCRKGIITPYKVGQRTYFMRSELVQVMFNQKSA